MSFLKSVVNALAIISMLVIFQSIMNFLAIDPSNYLLFLAWFIALIIFYYALPGGYKYFTLKK